MEPAYYGTGMLDEYFFNIKMFVIYLKSGFGRPSDNIKVDIRHGRKSRDDGIHLIKHPDGDYHPIILKKFSHYVDISINQFWRTLDCFINKELFEKVVVGQYHRKFKVGRVL